MSTEAAPSPSAPSPPAQRVLKGPEKTAVLLLAMLSPAVLRKRTQALAE